MTDIEKYSNFKDQCWDVCTYETEVYKRLMYEHHYSVYFDMEKDEGNPVLVIYKDNELLTVVDFEMITETKWMSQKFVEFRNLLNVLLRKSKIEKLLKDIK